MATYVPGKWITIRDPSGFVQRKYQPGHYATAGGSWVPKPTKTVHKVGSGGGTTTTTTSTGDYTTPSDADMEAKAHAMAAAQIAQKKAEIERQQAAAAAKARGDVATLQGLGQAQMGMISQIPAQLQGIRNNAGEAMAQFGNQISAASAAQQQGEQAQNAAFTASQTGGTAAATPEGLNAQAAAAASAQIGGVLPARQQAEIGAASASAAAGMPAVVARATQDQVVKRMADAATEDATYRSQLVDLATTEGGLYQDALTSLWDIEKAKYGEWESKQRLALDIQQQIDRHDALLASQVAAGQKTRAQAAKDKRNYDLAVRRVQVSEANSATSQATAHAGMYQDGKWGWTKAGYKHNAKGQLVKIPTPKAAPKQTGLRPGGGRGVDAANQMAKSFAQTKKKYYKWYDPNDHTKKNPATGQPGQWISDEPRTTYNQAMTQIVNRLVGAGFSRGAAIDLAETALDAAYPPKYRHKGPTPPKKANNPRAGANA